MIEQDWVIIDGDRVCPTQGLTPEEAEFFYRALEGGQGIREKIDFWNKRARKRAEGYESLTQKLKYKAPKRLAQVLKPHLTSGREILDLGCGTGLLGMHLQGLGVVVDGIDFSQSMVRKAKQRGYRNIVLANLEQNALVQAVPELGNKQYPVIMSCGVYGDFVDYRWLDAAFKLGAERLTLGIAGREEGLQGLMRYLRQKGFHMHHFSVREAHFVTDNLNQIKYVYVVAKR